MEMGSREVVQLSLEFSGMVFLVHTRTSLAKLMAKDSE
jgi:hypothetical protein